ncbi:hypothetical protein C8R44DRAFT_733450 [Mycena epipterygia]|nr:hypothetical protein C8R44DRAFT_733450 [Mycena epipterygia]
MSAIIHGFKPLPVAERARVGVGEKCDTAQTLVLQIFNFAVLPVVHQQNNKKLARLGDFFPLFVSREKKKLAEMMPRSQWDGLWPCGLVPFWGSRDLVQAQTSNVSKTRCGPVAGRGASALRWKGRHDFKLLSEADGREAGVGTSGFLTGSKWQWDLVVGVPLHAVSELEPGRRRRLNWSEEIEAKARADARVE